MELQYANRINKAAYLYKRMMTKILERFNLTYAQYQTLQVVHKYPGVTAKEMLIYLDTDKATLSGILSRLEKSNLIERQSNQNDRRLHHVHLKEPSVKICETVLALELENEEELLKGLKNKEYRNYNDVFEHIIDNQKKRIEYLSKAESEEDSQGGEV